MSEDIQCALESSIVGPLAKDGLIDVAEYSIDEVFNNEIIKQIPIVKTVIGTIQTGASIHDRLFLKKIVAFLVGINHISEKQRKKVVDKIDSSKRYRMKVGEKLLYIIDKCDDYTNAENVARLFSAMVNGDISYEQYLEASRIVSKISTDELNVFIESHHDSPSLYYEAIDLLHTGLVFVDTEKPEVEIVKHEPADWNDPQEYYDAEVHGGESSVRSTKSGDVVFKVFGGKQEQSII